MTVRLTLHHLDGTVMVEEHSSIESAGHRVLRSGTVKLAVIQELDAPEPTTWGKVNEGDEIIAPDNTCWRFEGNGGDGRVHLAAIDDGRPLTFPVRPDMPIRRRPGVLTAAVQLLHDVGLHGRPA